MVRHRIEFNNMEALKYDIRLIQKAVLDVFKAVADICESHKLRYYAFYGTALGAVRHGGFIPWDDDLDIAMPREDYIQFIKLVKSALPSHLKFARGGDGYLSPVQFGRVYDSREGLVDELSKRCNLRMKHPPFVDVFVLDGAPVYLKDFMWWWLRRKLIRLCQIYRYPKTYSLTGGGFKRWCVRSATRIIGFFVSFFYPRTATNEEFLCLMDKMSLDNAYDNSFMVVESTFFRYTTRRLMPKYMFEPARKIPFEDTEIRVPFKVEEILTRSYGDYMKLPPESQRIPEHALGYQGGNPEWSFD